MIDHLVLGGGGFVGRRLAHRIASDGKRVHVIDNCSEGTHPTEWKGWLYKRQGRDGGWTVYVCPDRHDGEIYFKEMDVRSGFDSLSSHQIGTVYHFAAVIGGRKTIDGEPLRIATDLSIDAECINWVIEAEADKFVYASSSAAYPIRFQNGDDTRRLVEEDITFDGVLGAPDMTYGWSKLTGEYLTRIAASDYDLDAVCIRPFSGYGERQSFDYPIPSIAKRAYERQDPLIVWGSGRQVRDFIHIEDCVEGILLAADRIHDGRAVNLGTGVPTDFIEVAQTFAQIAGYDPEIKSLPDKPEGVEFRCADTTRMRSVLDWKPELGIEKGFQRVFQFLDRRI